MLLFAIAVALGSLRGAVTADGGALPGVTVKLSSGSYSATSVSNAKGEYAFDDVPPGAYDVKFELLGFFPTTQRVSIAAGNRAGVAVAMKTEPRLAADIVEPPCVERPKSRWDWPSCKNYEFDDALLEAAQRGDRSAIELLRLRFDEEPAYRERYRVAAALLGRVGDDSAIWNELTTHAVNCIEFTDHPEKYEAYCSQHDCAPEEYEAVVWAALNAISLDRRARPLLLRALASADVMMVHAGIYALAQQHDESALPEIEKALKRVPSAATELAFFYTDAADALATKYLSNERRNDSP